MLKCCFNIMWMCLINNYQFNKTTQSPWNVLYKRVGHVWTPYLRLQLIWNRKPRFWFTIFWRNCLVLYEWNGKDHFPRRKTYEFCNFLDVQYRTMITSQPGSDKAASKNQRASAKVPDWNKQKEVKTAFSARQESVCIECVKGEHPIRTCKAFIDMTVSERRTTVSKHRLCFSCFGFNHQSATCGRRRHCTKCAERLHTLIHLDMKRALT